MKSQCNKDLDYWFGSPFWLDWCAVLFGRWRLVRVEFLTFPNQVVSDVSVRRVFPLVFILVALFSELSVLWPVDATIFI